MGALKLGLVAVVLVVLGFAAYVRLAPSDPVRWHDDPVAGQRPKDWGGTPEPLGQGAVMLTQLGSARALIYVFGAWAALIVCAFVLSRMLRAQANASGDSPKTGPTPGDLV